MKKFNIKDYQITGSEKFKPKNHSTKINDFYEDKTDYEAILKSLQTEMDELQSVMYAHSKYGVLAVFQAMDAAGKDGTMKAVFQGVHPLGLSFYSFKRPSETELNHDYMWRCYKELPERGKMQVFNRSYYEEVLVVKVHPEILENYQKIPDELKGKDVWKKRYQDIKNFEDYLANNGIVVLKFFLNVSKEEQGNRLIERIEDITKNWKFEEGDIKERGLWDDYQKAYEEMINATATKQNPWYVVPADDKKNMRLIVAKIIVEKLKELKMSYPEPDEARKQTLLGLIDTIKQQNQE
ncbi:polyphosphate kinase 2 family protein [Lacihabitans sp. CCS-44]|uniref:PPK2 family polyphosphate kinase n=1 Tax=Lacihabitans sp. CCS-44 TaxID=2487331 RepID=UPI0020CF6209|nr:PPK2 family polyphosphate kinase [Lacihabitans sp. CCS-44]MCP9756663.1 polyphosphate kinase 2 family protein [Lacihabitans sp. CCS-44]